MNIKGLFDYDRVLLAKDNLESELLMAKITATELTKQNDVLHNKILDLSREKWELKHELEKVKNANKVKWQYINAYTSQGTIAGWIPVEGSAQDILGKYPACFPDYMQEKKVPEA